MADSNRQYAGYVSNLSLLRLMAQETMGSTEITTVLKDIRALAEKEEFSSEEQKRCWMDYEFYTRIYPDEDDFPGSLTPLNGFAQQKLKRWEAAKESGKLGSTASQSVDKSVRRGKVATVLDGNTPSIPQPAASTQISAKQDKVLERLQVAVETETSDSDAETRDLPKAEVPDLTHHQRWKLAYIKRSRAAQGVNLKDFQRMTNTSLDTTKRRQINHPRKEQNNILDILKPLNNDPFTFQLNLNHKFLRATFLGPDGRFVKETEERMNVRFISVFKDGDEFEVSIVPAFGEITLRQSLDVVEHYRSILEKAREMIEFWKWIIGTANGFDSNWRLVNTLSDACNYFLDTECPSLKEWKRSRAYESFLGSSEVKGKRPASNSAGGDVARLRTS